MTSTTTYTQPTPSRLADRRRFRQSLGGFAGAAVITVGSAVVMAPAASAATTID